MKFFLRNISLLSVLILCAQFAAAAVGQLDPTFNGTGKVMTSMGQGNDIVEGLVVQPDGKIVCVGYSSNASNIFKIALIRYNANGTLDTSFNGTGKVLLPVGAGEDWATGLALQPDGKIVVGGTTLNGSSDDFAIIRFNSDGTLDNSFGTGGVVKTHIAGHDRVTAIDLQYDGKIVVAGVSYLQKGGMLTLLARYDSNGALDPGFGQNGIVREPRNVWEFLIRELKVLPNGKIVAAGHGSDNNPWGYAVFAAGRYEADGKPDETFNLTGRVYTEIGTDFSRGFGLVVQDDGKIVVGGGSNDFHQESDYTMARYTTSGTLDPSFGQGGIVITDLSNRFDIAQAMTLQPDGKLLLAGEQFENDIVYGNYGITRYSGNGVLDSGFGSGGLASVDWNNGTDFATAIAVQPDGNIIVAGSVTEGGFNRVFGMMRITGDSPIPAAARVNGRIEDTRGNAIRNARVIATDIATGEARNTITNAFGFYQFEGLPTNRNYRVNVAVKRYRFHAPRSFRLLGNINELLIKADSEAM